MGEWRPRKGRFAWRCMVFGPLISTLASTDCQWHGFEIWPLCKHTWFLSNTGGRCQHLLLFSARSCSHRLGNRNLRRVPITGQFLQWFIHELVYSLYYSGFESGSSFKSIFNNFVFIFYKFEQAHCSVSSSQQWASVYIFLCKFIYFSRELKCQINSILLPGL